mmetsp:Transcript_9013/g.8191  ORF Transcript_9013/g.8191 Transcript_9013/m.8191 type:complete len:146 (-) Transcript_9013:3-440(-)
MAVRILNNSSLDPKLSLGLAITYSPIVGFPVIPRSSSLISWVWKSNRYIVLMDPLDGSSNIDVNVPVGTIFSVLRRASEINHKPKIDDYLQKGRNIMAAGYVLYGSSTMLVMSTGNGVHGFTLDPSIGTLYLTHPHMRFPKSRKH